jgi:hypothetical protein
MILHNMYGYLAGKRVEISHFRKQNLHILNILFLLSLRILNRLDIAL